MKTKLEIAQFHFTPGKKTPSDFVPVDWPDMYSLTTDSKLLEKREQLLIQIFIIRIAKEKKTRRILIC
jgi:hypothetical protein